MFKKISTTTCPNLFQGNQDIGNTEFNKTDNYYAKLALNEDEIFRLNIEELTGQTDNRR